MNLFDQELERLEGQPTTETDWRAKMWRRSYCVALNAIRVLERRVARLEREQWESPMVLFHEAVDEQHLEETKP